MWNSLTVLYVALVAIAAALVLGGASAGVRMAWRWPAGAPAGEARDDFDRQHHLMVTLMRVGALAGIVLTPLWFWALDSLVPAVQGGMCMASVHNLGSPGSWVASALKAVVPALLIYWLVIDREDRRRDDERLMRHKQKLLIVVAAAVLTSTVLDLHFFFTLELRPTVCCMTLFDGPGLATGSDGVAGWEWTGLFGGAVILQGLAWALGRLPSHASLARRLTLVLAPVAIGSLVMALHTRLGSTLMGRDHHCIFCAWQQVPASFAATMMVAVGAWWLFARAGLEAALGTAADSPEPRAGIDDAAPIALLLGGAMLLAALAAL